MYKHLCEITDASRSFFGVGTWFFLPDEVQVPELTPFPVLIRYPNGASRSVAVRFGTAHLNYPYELRGTPGYENPWKNCCDLRDITPDELPEGTEMCWDDEEGE